MILSCTNMNITKQKNVLTSIDGGFRLDITGGEHLSGLVETLRIGFFAKNAKNL